MSKTIGSDVDHRADSPWLNEAAGRLLIVGFEGVDFSPELETLITAVRPAGLVFFRRNYPEPDGPARLRRLIEKASGLSLSLTGRPLLVAIDHEGGTVQRLPPPYTAVPPASELAAGLTASEMGELIERAAAELAATGFNFNFAPVADVSSPLSAFVGSRSYGDDPETVANFGLAFVDACRRCGVLSCAKHFPGLGSAAVDPHQDLPVIAVPGDRLMLVDVEPFRRLIVRDLPAVMTTHALYPALDAEYPATFSERIVGLLKKDLGFQGPVLTDDLEMGALKNQPIGEAAVRAVRAGHDFLLVCRRADYIDECRRGLAEAVARGRLSETRLEDAFSRQALLLRRLEDGWPRLRARDEWFRRLTAASGFNAGSEAPIDPLDQKGNI
ncbi:MAG: beta-N-acetylhexosaminidase [Candidatus Adiutrix sp.]|nr:beta-N-acetylhexosaminidase [Candidatus Adiutrix sp.]